MVSWEKNRNDSSRTWGDSTTRKAFVLHTVTLGSISDIPVGSPEHCWESLSTEPEYCWKWSENKIK